MTTTTPAGRPTVPSERAHDVIVDPDWVADHLTDPSVRLVEVDVSPAAYRTGHIPGAVLWNIYTDLRTPDYKPINAIAFANLLSKSGITPQSTVVFYGSGAYLGFWLMKRYRHPQARVMAGPRDRWQDSGRLWSTHIPPPGCSQYALPCENAAIVARREAVGQLITNHGGAILDVRSREEFNGERFWPSGTTKDAGRPGHIPGALHLPSDLIRADDSTLKPPAQLRALLDTRGIGNHTPVLTYCTIGNRASQVWFALTQVLGYPDVSIYYGSWVEWGRLTTTPIET